MKRILKFDFYVTSKNVITWILLGAIFVISVFSLYITFNLMDGDNISIGGNSISEFFTDVDPGQASFFYCCADLLSGDFISLFIIIFSSLIIGKDYSTGFMKNVYGIIDRKKILFSKYILLITYNLIIYATIMLAVLVGRMTFLEFDSMGDIVGFVKVLLLQLLFDIVIESIIISLVLFFKKANIPLVIGIVYSMVVSSMLYQVINSVVKKINESSSFDITRYTVFGNLTKISISIAPKDVMITSLVGSIFFVTFFITNMRLINRDL